MTVNDDLAQLERTADYLATVRDLERVEKERRDALIVGLRDQGVSWRTIAGAARCSISQCSTIVATAPSAVEVAGGPAPVPPR